MEPLLSGLSVSGLIGFLLALLWLPDRDFSPIKKSTIIKAQEISRHPLINGRKNEAIV